MSKSQLQITGEKILEEAGQWIGSEALEDEFYLHRAELVDELQRTRNVLSSGKSPNLFEFLCLYSLQDKIQRLLYEQAQLFPERSVRTCLSSFL